MKISELIESIKDFPDLKKSQETASNTFNNLNDLLSLSISLKKKLLNISAPTEWAFHYEKLEKMLNDYYKVINDLIDGNEDEILKTPLIQDLKSYKNMLTSKKADLDLI